jgi:Flp pilus assembly protein TadD
MARHVRQIVSTSVDAHQGSLLGRARKFRQKGELKKALGVLREACVLDEDCAWLWSLYGALLVKHGRADEGRAALRHAIWLRRSAGDAARVRSTQRIVDRIGHPSAAA